MRNLKVSWKFKFQEKHDKIRLEKLKKKAFAVAKTTPTFRTTKTNL